jgi:Putative auto-transporter adhesin, head GIN domain
MHNDMKAILPLLSLLIVLLATNCQAQWGKIKGEGPVITKTIDLADFHSFGLGISGDVVLTQGSKQEVKIKGQANIIDNIKTKVRNNSWNIEFEESVRDYDELTIYITVPTLEEVSVGGSGNITSTNSFDNLNDIDISIGGSGNVNLDFNAKDVDVSIGGSGEISLNGKGDDLTISIGGSGNVKAFDFQVNTCEISSAGSGDINVHVAESLEVSLVGSGDVTYKGNPRVKSSIVGSGDVAKH